MGQNQSNDEKENHDEEMPRCIVSDPAQPHNFSHRARQKVKRDCTACGNDPNFLMAPYHIHYYCIKCDLEFHEGCLKKPSKMIHPYHPQHPLVFTALNYETGMIADTNIIEYAIYAHHQARAPCDCENSETIPISMFDVCTWCGNDLREWFYHCKICNFCLDFHCASKCPPLTIQDPKSHHHPLALFPRPLSFPCNACGLIEEYEPSYACYQCNYVVHQSCIDLPRVIKITRHRHRLYHTPYLPAKGLPCRICYRNVDIKYGQYSCNHDDCSYVAHSKCATHKSIWDGKELEWEIEEPENAEDIAPYKKVGGGLIEHCWHGNHYLKLEKYDDTRDLKKQCQACMRSIISQDFYSCIECDFFLHEVCANLPRKVDHALHIHSLFMEPYPRYDLDFLMLSCSACSRLSSGMKYSCRKKGCAYKGKTFQVDVNCILVPECFTHESHAEDSLFISSFIYTDESEISCEGCKREVDGYHLECVSCDFSICYRCATIPHEIYHKYDEDPLTLCYGEDGVDDDDTYWCEVCERRLYPHKWFYMNSERCTTIHLRCLFGYYAYMKPGYTVHNETQSTQSICFRYLGITEDFDPLSTSLQVVSNDSSSRHMCQGCHLRCRDLLCLKVNGIEVFICSIRCYEMFECRNALTTR